MVPTLHLLAVESVHPWAVLACPTKHLSQVRVGELGRFGAELLLSAKYRPVASKLHEMLGQMGLGRGFEDVYSSSRGWPILRLPTTAPARGLSTRRPSIFSNRQRAEHKNIQSWHPGYRSRSPIGYGKPLIYIIPNSQQQKIGKGKGTSFSVPQQHCRHPS